MKNIWIFIFLLVLALQSCKSFVNPFLAFKSETWEIIELKKNEEVVSKNTCSKFIFNSSEVLIPSKVDGILDTFLFDTGASVSLVRFDTIGNNCNKLQLRTHKGKSRVNVSFDTCNIDNDVVRINKAFKLTMQKPIKNIECEIKQFRDILGNEIIQNKVFCLKFSDSTICLYDSLEINTDKYFNVKSKFDHNSFSIFLYYNGVEYSYLFDTGASGTLMLEKKYYRQFKQKEDFVIEGSIFLEATGMINSKTYVKTNQLISINSRNIDLKSVIFSKSVDRNIAGINFISGFDWVIDWKNEKVYARILPETLKVEPIDNNDFIQTYGVFPKDGQLFIIARLLNHKPIYSLDSVIKSVDGIKITKDNICYYYKLLNTSNWNNYKVIVGK